MTIKVTNKGAYCTLTTQLDKLARHNRQGSFRTKERYYEALTMADTKGDFRPLAKIVIKELFRTMMEINKH